MHYSSPIQVKVYVPCQIHKQPMRFPEQFPQNSERQPPNTLAIQGHDCKDTPKTDRPPRYICRKCTPHVLQSREAIIIPTDSIHSFSMDFIWRHPKNSLYLYIGIQKNGVPNLGTGDLQEWSVESQSYMRNDTFAGERMKHAVPLHYVLEYHIF